MAKDDKVENTEEDDKGKRNPLFSIIVPSINKKTGNVFESGEVTDSSYEAFMLNRMFSMGSDTIFFAAELNKRQNLNPKAHYDFCYYAIPEKPYRFNNWAKKEVDDNLEYVMKYYDYNETKAKAALKILDKKQLKDIKKYVETYINNQQ